MEDVVAKRQMLNNFANLIYFCSMLTLSGSGPIYGYIHKIMVLPMMLMTALLSMR